MSARLKKEKRWSLKAKLTVAFIVLLYALRRHTVLQAMAGCCMLPMKWRAGLAFIPISMYNGRRGFIRGQLAKYLFYAFYPAHLLIIYLLQTMLYTS